MNTILSTLHKIYKHGAPSYILSFGDSLGDNLLLTTLARELYERGHKNIWIKCNHESLFRDNPYVKAVLPYHTLLSTTVLKFFGVSIAFPRYTVYEKDTDRDIIPEKHIVLKMADAVNLQGGICNKPVFRLTSEEIEKGKMAASQIVITSSNAGANFSMKNKEWIHERYQQVIDRFYQSYTFIQLGSAADPVFEHVVDLRNKTSIRESAALLQNAVLLISHVGFMMHLARAVDCRSVILYGGREKPEQSGYGCFANIYSAVACSPCWLHNRCDFHKKCMEMITAEMVAHAVSQQLQLADTPLTTDILCND